MPCLALSHFCERSSMPQMKEVTHVYLVLHDNPSEIQKVYLQMQERTTSCCGHSCLLKIWVDFKWRKEEKQFLWRKLRKVMGQAHVSLSGFLLLLQSGFLFSSIFIVLHTTFNHLSISTMILLGFYIESNDTATHTPRNESDSSSPYIELRGPLILINQIKGTMLLKFLLYPISLEENNHAICILHMALE